MAQRFPKRRRLFIRIAFVLFVCGLTLIAIISPPAESKYLKDPTLVATKSPNLSALVPPNTGSSMRQRFYKIYYEAFPPKRGAYSFHGRAAPVRCSIHGLLNQ